MKLHKILYAICIIAIAGNYALGQYEKSESMAEVEGIKFTIDDPSGGNSVTFKSTAPLEDIVGTSRDITGYVIFDPNDANKGGYGEFMVPVASLETGIPLRDQHLRSEAWLNADRYPYITLIIQETKDIKEVKSMAGSSTYDAILVGEFSFHGVSNKVEIPGRFTYLKETEKTRQRLPGDLLAGRANFDLALKDYGVTGPPGLGLIGSKVGEVISVEVSFVGNTQALITDDSAGNGQNELGLGE